MVDIVDTQTPAARLRQYRVARRMSQTDLAKEIGLTNASRISAYETERARPGLETALAIQKLTEIPASLWV